MKYRHPAVVVLEGSLLLIVLLVAGDRIGRTFIYRYTPSPEHESAFLRDYSPAPVVKSFAVPYSIEMSTGVSSGAGSKFVTNERTIEPTFTVETDRGQSFMTAISEDVAAQLIKDGATIVSKKIGPQGQFQLSYRDGTSAGSVATSPLAEVPGQSGPPTAGTRRVRAHIVISEKWFPKEVDAVRASTQS